jgi:DNA mismatch repair protein MutS
MELEPYSLANDYIKNFQKYEKIYDNIAILMQVGSFYEIYSWDLPDLKVGNTQKLSKVLNLKVTLKNKSKKHSVNNCIMAGFSQVVVEKYIKILLDNFYTVILINQDKINPNIRTVSEIISPGTNLTPDTADNNYLMCIYLEETVFKNKPRKIVGLSMIDVSTGKNLVCELTDVLYDEDYSINETIRIILSYQPTQVIIYNYNINIKNQELINLLCLNNTMTTIKKHIHPEFVKIAYQTSFLSEIFKNNGMLDVIDYLNLEKNEFARLSYILLLKFVEGHNSSILKYIHTPQLIQNNQNLHLDYNTSLQLNLISERTYAHFNFSKISYADVFSVIDNTRTVLGKRLLKYRLLHPIKNTDILNQRYSLIDKLCKDEKYKCFLKFLDNINDLERFQRKMSLKIIEPQDFDILDNSYSNIREILELCNEDILLKTHYEKFITYDKLDECVNYYNKIFNIEKMKYEINRIDENIFNINKYQEVIELDKKIKEHKTVINKFKNKYSHMLIKELNKRKKTGKKISLDHEVIKIDVVNSITYLTLTKTRANILKSIIKSKNDNAVIKTKSKGTMFITTESLENTINTLQSDLEEFRKIAKKCFLDEIEIFYNNFNNFMKNIILFISDFDFLISGAICSIKNNYCRPIIEEKENSFFDIIGMRHPIVEKINEDIKFVTNDLRLDNEKLGVILSGINGIGKSSLLKNIGINIVIAQIGYYVPAKSMCYYPFHNILTRIMGNDNILTGTSSYAVEINELRSILHRSNQDSLILIDEFARGTEFYSALSLTASCIEHLSNEIKPKFIITTHLHRLFDFKEITSIQNVMIKYMDIDIDENGTLIYKRKLRDGVTYQNYGLKIAKALGIDNTIISRAEYFRNILRNEATEIMPIQNSKYNSNFYIKECKICKTNENLEVHHIDFQCNSNENGFFNDGNHKNIKGNLITLCKKHHIDLHQGKYKISERVQTTNGIVLKIEEVHSDEEVTNERLIELILNHKFRNTFKYVKEILEKEYNIYISMYKIKKIYKENI